MVLFQNYYEESPLPQIVDGIITINSSNNFNTDLNNPSPTGEFDLYTVLLHEVFHSLGFYSNILFHEVGNLVIPKTISDYQGNCIDYFSAYDNFLKDPIGDLPLILNSGQSNYEWNWNQTINPTERLLGNENCVVIAPGDPGISICYQVCSDWLVYSSSQITETVYTPPIFDPGSSLSHFDDYCYSTPSGFLANQPPHFLMNSYGVPYPEFGFRKPSIEEVKALCDLGYKITGTFGSPSILSGEFHPNYSTYDFCELDRVAGVNDLIDNGYYAGDIINVGNILGNDFNATHYEELEVVFGNGSITNQNSSNGTFTYIPGSIIGPGPSNDPSYGYNVVKYIPKTTNGTLGNITYVFIKILVPEGCTQEPSCNLVPNGNFENSFIRFGSGEAPTCWNLLSTYNQINGLVTFSRDYESDLDGRKIPIQNNCGLGTYQSFDTWELNTIGSSNPNNHNVLGLFGTITNNGAINNCDAIYTQLNQPLLAGHTYKLSCYVKREELYASLNSPLPSRIGFWISQTEPDPILQVQFAPFVYNLIGNRAIYATD